MRVGCIVAQGVLGGGRSCRVLYTDNDELAWMVRANHGPDEARDPLDKRGSVPCTARRLVWGSDVFPGVVDQWPGVEAAARGKPSEESPEPQAVPGREAPPLVSPCGGIRESTLCHT